MGIASTTFSGLPGGFFGPPALGGRGTPFGSTQAQIFSSHV